MSTTASQRINSISVSLCIAGPYGGCRAAMQLLPFLSELTSVTIPTMLSLPKVAGVLSEAGELLNTEAGYDGKADRLINQLDWYTHAIKNHKKNAGAGPMPQSR